MNYEKAIMLHMPQDTYIYADTLFKATHLKSRQKFNYTLSALQNRGFISIGVCDDIILLEPYEYFKQYLKRKRYERARAWLPIVISLIALIKSFFPQLALLWQLLMQLLK